MPVMNFDLEDGLSKISFTLMPDDAIRFMAFMAECDSYKNQRNELLAALKGLEEACDKRASCLSAEAYLVAERCEGMRDALYALDNARSSARAAIAKAEAN